MTITADSTCEIRYDAAGPILEFLESDPAYIGMIEQWNLLSRRSGYITVSPIVRYNISSAVRAKLASLDWIETENETMRNLIRALRLLHGC